MMQTFNGKTIVDLLTFRAAEQAEKVAYNFAAVAGSNEKTIAQISYLDLYTMAKAIAVVLKRHGIKTDDRILLLYPPGTALIHAFFGCICAGAIPVLAYPPTNHKLADKLKYIIRDADPSALMSTNASHDNWVRISKIKTIPLAHGAGAGATHDALSEIGAITWIPTDAIHAEIGRPVGCS